MPKHFDINKLRIASPCTIRWETMAGDNKTRHCDLCELNVYNFAEMTEREIRAVAEKSNGQICGRMFRRADGTVIMKDCPVGVRALRRRAAKYVGAAFAGILGLFTAAAAQTKEPEQCQANVQIFNKTIESAKSIISGQITDASGIDVGKLKLVLVAANGRKMPVVTDSAGNFSVKGLGSGKFSLEIVGEEAINSLLKDIEVGKSVNTFLEIRLSSVVVTAQDISLTENIGTISVITTHADRRLIDLPINN